MFVETKESGLGTIKPSDPKILFINTIENWLSLDILDPKKMIERNTRLAFSRYGAFESWKRLHLDQRISSSSSHLHCTNKKVLKCLLPPCPSQTLIFSKLARFDRHSKFVRHDHISKVMRLCTYIPVHSLHYHETDITTLSQRTLERLTRSLNMLSMLSFLSARVHRPIPHPLFRLTYYAFLITISHSLYIVLSQPSIDNEFSQQASSLLRLHTPICYSPNLTPLPPLSRLAASVVTLPKVNQIKLHHPYIPQRKKNLLHRSFYRSIDNTLIEH